MQFENTFELAGTPEQVIAIFENVPLLAGFLPGASVEDRREDGSYPGKLAVAFGAKRLTFKGSLTNAVQREQLAGVLTGAASADVRGAKMLVTMTYHLSASGADTRVHLVSEAELTGILAEFARTGGVVLTQALLEDFAKNFSAHMRNTMPAPAGESAPAPSPPGPAPALSGFALLWKAFRSFFSRRPRPNT